MKRILLALIFFIAANTIIVSQNTIGTISITNDVDEGFTLFTMSTQTYLINNCGEVINEWTSTFPPGVAVYLLENGNILRAGRTNSTDIQFGGQGGVLEMYDWDGNLTWQYFYDTPQHRQHHDVYPMPNGNVIILAATVMTNTEAIQAGRDPNLLLETRLFNEQLIEVQPSGLNGGIIVWEWNFNDHLVQDIDNTKDNFGDVSLSENKLDINFLNGGTGGSNWLHVNSVQYNSILDQIIISSRLLSEFYIIDHSTTTAEAATGSGGTYGKGGDFLFRWGNPQSYRQGLEADRQLFGQHYAHAIGSGLIDEGKIMLFNNGNGRAPSFSEAFVLDLPTDSPGVYSYTSGTAYGPSAPDYIYKDPTTPTNFYSAILSNAQRLQNGNTLIFEGINGRVFEIDTNENMVWEYIIPINTNTGTIATQGDLASGIPNASFRAIKYPLTFGAFDGRDLTPGNPIELNPDLAPCNNLSITDFTLNDVKIYPNPAYDTLILETNSNIDSIELYNILGTKINSVYNTNIIDLSKLNSGLYLIKIHSNGISLTKKIIKK